MYTLQGLTQREIDAVLRPRERRPFTVRLDLAAPSDGQRGEIEWILEPVEAAGAR